MPPRAILIDCDGVLADLENHHVAAWQRIVGTMGLPLDDQTAARLAEVDDHTFLTAFFEERNIPPDQVDTWVDRKRALVAELLRSSPRLRPGALELVEALRGRARLALISGASREEVEALLEGAGIADAFAAIIADEESDGRHPGPEAFKAALGKLRLSLSSVAAIVGSASSLSAARETGLRRVVAVGHHQDTGDQVVVAALTPVEDVLAELGL